MKRIRWTPIILVAANLAIISLVAIRFLNLTYPMVGHDYSLAIPSLLDIFLHYHINGFSIQWYSPTFGGGLPGFPDPNNSQFSVFGLLSLLVSPWQSVIISSIAYIALGGIASYYLFIRVLKLSWTSSILGMVFFSANGYIMERLAVGHLGYVTFPVIAVLLVLLLDPTIPRMVAGLAFSLVIAMLVHQGGYFLIIAFGLSFLLIFPSLYIYRPEIVSWKRISAVIALGGFVALIITSSKLAAVYAFMRFFPRQIADTYQTPGLLAGLVGIACQLLGSMNLAPLLLVDKSHGELLIKIMQFFSRAPYGYWEFDMSMSPVVFGILIMGIYSFLKKPKKYSGLITAQKKWIAWIVLLFFTWLTIEFILAKGLMYPLLSKLPILSSLHVNPRYTVTFLFPLAMLAAIIYDKWITKWPARKVTNAFIIMNVLTLVPLSSYFMIQADLQSRIYNITDSEKIYAAIRAGDTLNVTAIGDKTVDNTKALSMHSSNLVPYDPIFGYNLENFHPEIKPGSIWEVSDGYYNMTDPSGYVFPQINNTRPFERIPVSEKAQLEAFASHHQQPGWKIPLYQQILDWVSGLSAAFVTAFLALAGIRSLVKRFLYTRRAILKD